MNTSEENKVTQMFEPILDKNEKVLWSDRPKFTPYFFVSIGKNFYLITFGIVWLVMNMAIKPESNDFVFKYFWVWGLLPLAQGLYSAVKSVFSYSNTSYAFTDKRVIVRTGFFGTEYKTIDYDKISDIEVKISMFERYYNVGSVRFFSGRMKEDEGSFSKIYDSWIAIANPYEVFKQLKQTAVDIKTDFNYPNALRPETNPGYNTDYEKK